MRARVRSATHQPAYLPAAYRLLPCLCAHLPRAANAPLESDTQLARTSNLQRSTDAHLPARTFSSRAELFLLDAATIGFLWIPLGGLIIFNRVDGREAEMIEEIEAERGADPNYELDRAWDLAQNADARVDGTGDGTAL